ncbi:MAG: hypothetical protein Q8867_06345 [Bacteroidota bacterium]|nr:hypothetical protein [Bacteroidota bacterium]
MKKILFVLCLISMSAFGQSTKSGFNFALSPYDTTTQEFMPSFPVEPIGDNDFVTVDTCGNFVVNGKPLRI